MNTSIRRSLFLAAICVISTGCIESQSTGEITPFQDHDVDSCLSIVVDRSGLIIWHLSGAGQVSLFEGRPEDLRKRFKSSEEFNQFLLDRSNANGSHVFDATCKAVEHLRSVSGVTEDRRLLTIILGNTRDTDGGILARVRMTKAPQCYQQAGGESLCISLQILKFRGDRASWQMLVLNRISSSSKASFLQVLDFHFLNKGSGKMTPRVDGQPIGLLDDLPRGRNAKCIGTAPHAYFESPENLAATESLRFDATKNVQSKFFLGIVGGKVIDNGRSPNGQIRRHVSGGIPIGLADDRHHCVWAGSRGGKGRSVLIPNLILLPQTTSLLCVDPKGDLARITARYRADDLKQRTCVLDPFGVSGSGTERFRVSFDPLASLDPDDSRNFVPNARLIADSLIPIGELKDRHWADTSRQCLAALICHVRTHQRYADMRDLVTVWHLASELTSPDPNDPSSYWLEKEMVSNDAAGGVIRNGARQFYGRRDGEFSSVLSNLQKHLDFIGIECVQQCLTGESIDLKDLKRDSMALYITLPAMRMNDLSGWLRMNVQLALAAHEEERTQTGGSTVMVLDEFHTLGNLACLETAAAQIAGLGVKLVPVIQDLGQLKAHYRNWETFIGNAGVIQVFALADQTTLEYVQKRLGESPTLSRSTRSPGFEEATKNAATGESWNVGVHPLMNAEEVARYFARDDKKLRQLIIRPGYLPAILMRPFYDQHELFRGRFDDA